MRKAQAKFENGCEHFPILYEGYGVRIFKNPCGEIFIRDAQSGVTMRLKHSTNSSGGLEFTTEGSVEPIRINNMIGWRVCKRN